MKIMSKSKIIYESSESYILKEKDILSQLKSDFIINMVCSFQDFSNLYLVLRLMTGGDLRYHLYYYNKPFTEEMIKFIIMNISLCLNFIHQNGIIHRDIKPENFVFDENGYLHLTDFGLAIYKEENSFTDMNNYSSDEEENENEKYLDIEMVGTIGYIAPEIILGMDKYTNAVDFYALGVISYELIFGYKPYNGLTRYQIGKDMLEDKVNYQIDIDYSDKLINFVKNLLKINPKERICRLNAIKENEYFRGLNWDSIQYKNYNSPFIDIIQYLRKRNTYENINELFEVEKCRNPIILDDETKLKLSQIEASPSYIHAFQDYTYINLENDDFNDMNFLFKNEKTITTERTKKKLKRERSVKCIYRVNKNNVILPPINPNLLKNIYKYKLKRYNELLDKLDKKDDDKSDKKEKKEKKEKKHRNHRRHRRHSYDDSSSSSGKPLIINNFCPQSPNNGYGYNYNPYYSNPFLSVQNNFILPKINPYLKGLNNNEIKDNNTYSKYSSSETYEKLKLKNKSKEKDKKSKLENTQKNKSSNVEEKNNKESIKESSKQKKDKNEKKKKSLSNKNNEKSNDKSKEKNEDKKSSKSKENKEIKKKDKNSDSKSKSKNSNEKSKKKKTESSKKEKSSSNKNGEEEEENEEEEEELSTIQEKTEEKSNKVKLTSENKDESEKDESNSNSNEEEEESD